MVKLGSLTSVCCQTLSLILKDKVSFSGSAQYNASVNSYWSVQEVLVQPHCIVSPATAQDVSTAIRILASTRQSSSDCPFAIRSGGHASFQGAANIQGGVTMDLSNLNSINLDRGTVSAGPGATWGDVYSYLDPLGLSVNGGRVGAVGVGGLTLGGGISFFGPQFGWTCDMVSNFEVVLASGAIVNTNQSEHAELQWALRGGTSNFGVITRVDLQSFEQGNLWGGEAVYPISTADQQIAALVAFNNPTAYDNLASLITTFAYSEAQNISVVVNNMEYAKPVENPAAFQNFSDLPAISNSRRVTNMTSLATEGTQGDPNGLRQANVALTIKSTAQALHATVRAWNASIPSIRHVPGVVWSLGMDLLPPALYARHAQDNSLGLGRQDGESLIIVHFTAAWSTVADDKAVYAAAQDLMASIEEDVGKLNALDPFIYLNYAAPWQNPIRSYGQSSVDRLLRTQQRYDPHHVFTHLVPGGFKIPSPP